MKKKEATGLDVLQVYFGQARKHFFKLLTVFVFITIGNIASIAIPWVMKDLFNLLEQTTPTSATFAIFTPVLTLFVSVKLLEWFFWRVHDFIYIPYLPKSMADLELSAYKKLLAQSESYFQNEFAGSLTRQIRRLSDGFDQFSSHVIFEIYPTTAILVGSIIGLSIQRPILGLAFGIWVTVFIGIQFFLTRIASRYDVRRDELDSSLSGEIADSVSNAITIKSFATEDLEFQKLTMAEQKLAKATSLSWTAHMLIFTIQTLLIITIEVSLYYFGVKLWLAEQITLGDIAFIQTFLALVFFKIWDVARIFRKIASTITGSKEIVTMMNQKIEITDISSAQPLKVRAGKIVFSKVSFAFQKNQPVIKNLSLTIDAKQKVALIGPSGAGKSTMVKLLMRFFDLQKGTITIDGQNTAKVTQASLRSAISIVPQDPILFHRSLLDNIRYGKQDATMDEVIDAAKKAHCHEFISALKDGYETFVGERGVKLSGGERQRVAIARAILRNAPILVLDEATSALDSQSEQLIQAALRELMKNKTVIVIAHRLSTIMMMDKIVVIENGKITDIGTHTELLKNRGTYNKLWELQAGAFN